MIIAILSDIHDNIWNLQKALDLIQGKAELIIFCGDMCAPSTAAMLSGCHLPIHAFPGNNDEDQFGLFQMGGRNTTWYKISDEFAQLESQGQKIAFCHYPVLAEYLADSGKFDAVFHGHTHQARNEKRDNTLLLNPGSVCGIVRGVPGQASFALYDTSTNTAEIINI